MFYCLEKLIEILNSTKRFSMQFKFLFWILNVLLNCILEHKNGLYRNFWIYIFFYSYFLFTFGFHIYLSFISIYLLQLTYKVRSARVWRLTDCLGWRPRGFGLCHGRSCWRGWWDLRIALLWGPCGTAHIFVVDRNIISILNMKCFYTFIRLIFRST